MGAVTQQSMWDVIKDYSESKKQQVFNFALTLQEPQARPELDFDSYCVPTERGKHIEEYMKEMRDNDRL